MSGVAHVCAYIRVLSPVWVERTLGLCENVCLCADRAEGKDAMRGVAWWLTPLFPGLGVHRQPDLREFEANLVIVPGQSELHSGTLLWTKTPHVFGGY